MSFLLENFQLLLKKHYVIAFIPLVVQSQSLRLNYYSSIGHLFGRLEIYYLGEWIPFTINTFDMHEADLACRWLGYGFASSYATVAMPGKRRLFIDTKMLGNIGNEQM